MSQVNQDMTDMINQLTDDEFKSLAESIIKLITDAMERD